MKFDDFAEQSSLLSPFCLSPASVLKKKKRLKYAYSNKKNNLPKPLLWQYSNCQSWIVVRIMY